MHQINFISLVEMSCLNRLNSSWYFVSCYVNIFLRQHYHRFGTEWRYDVTVVIFHNKSPNRIYEIIPTYVGFFLMQKYCNLKHHWVALHSRRYLKALLRVGIRVRLFVKEGKTTMWDHTYNPYNLLFFFHSEIKG